MNGQKVAFGLFCLISWFNFQTATAQTAAPGWIFQKTTKETLMRVHPEQIGTLRAASDDSSFFTVPVVLLKKSGLSNRSQSARLSVIEKEASAFLASREMDKPTYKQAKVIDETPTIEMEFGKLGEGKRWLYAAAHDDHILIMYAEGRSSKPSEQPEKNARDTFFKMAKLFVPPRQ